MGSRIEREAAKWAAQKEYAAANRLHPLLRMLNNPITDVVTLPLALTGVGTGAVVAKQALTTATKAGVKKKASQVLKERTLKHLPREMAIGAGGLAGYEAAATLTNNPLLQLAASVASGGGVTAGTRGLSRMPASATPVPKMPASATPVPKMPASKQAASKQAASKTPVSSQIASGLPASKQAASMQPRSVKELLSAQIPVVPRVSRGGTGGTGGAGGAGSAGSMVPPSGGGGGGNMVPPSGGLGARALDKALGDIASNPLLSNVERTAKAAELLAKNGDAATLKILADATGMPLSDLRKILEKTTPEELSRYATIQDFIAAKTGNNDALKRLEGLRDQTMHAGNTTLDEAVRLGDDTLLARWGLEGGDALPEVTGQRVQMSLREAADAMRRERSAIMSPQYKQAFGAAEGTPTMTAAMEQLQKLDADKYSKGLTPQQRNAMKALVKEVQAEGGIHGLQGLNDYTRVLNTMAVDAGRQQDSLRSGALKRLRHDVKGIVRAGAPGIEQLDAEFARMTREAEADRFGSLYNKLTKPRRGGLGEEQLEFAVDPAKMVSAVAGASESDVAKLAATLPVEIRRELADGILAEAATRKGTAKAKLLKRAGIANPEIADRVAGAMDALSRGRTTAKATGTEYDKRRRLIDNLGRDIWSVVSDIPGLREVANTNTVAAIGDAASATVGATPGRNIQAFASADPVALRQMVMRGDIPPEVAVDALKAQKIAEVGAKMSPYQATTTSKIDTERGGMPLVK